MSQDQTTGYNVTREPIGHWVIVSTLICVSIALGFAFSPWPYIGIAVTTGCAIATLTEGFMKGK